MLFDGFMNTPIYDWVFIMAQFLMMEHSVVVDVWDRNSLDLR